MHFLWKVWKEPATTLVRWIESTRGQALRWDQSKRRPPLEADFLHPLWLEGTWGLCPTEILAFPRSGLDWTRGRPRYASSHAPHMISLLNHLPDLPKMIFGFFFWFVSHSSCCFWIVYGREGGNISVTSPSTIGGSLRGGKLRQKVGAVAVGSASIRYLETVEGRIQNWEHRGTVGGSRALRHQMARPAVLGEALTFTGAWSWKIHWQILKDFKQGFN